MRWNAKMRSRMGSPSVLGLALMLVLGLTILFGPGLAEACSVCFSARDENRTAFLVTTIFLSVLPLALIGSAIWWLWRRIQQLETARPVGGQR